MKPSPCGESIKNELPNSAVPEVKMIPVCCNMHHSFCSRSFQELCTLQKFRKWNRWKQE